ncbi:MAG TPA: twin-arginine translocase TatA/TatE family subunit [Elusimicrobia bacterium]|nr:twin-arginine translocase TatA/TatE family subunit [Elusimicrobiota bacterium]HBT62191.1 twin-arginine translocase TatA/TatE family subunit [Elusimicrobiota bacterium]
MGNIGYGELLLIVLVGLLLFGPNKIPELARACGRAVNMFKRGMREGLEDDKNQTQTPRS